MDSMIERVAEAMWQGEWARAGNGGPRRVPWSAIAESDRARYRFVAIAAIKAMREPTPEMALSGYGKITLRIERDETDLYEAWRAMIDAALATQEG